MIENIAGLPPELDGLRAEGMVTREDYQQVLEPILEQARRDGRRIRLLYHLGPSFEGFTAGAAWEDLKVGLHFLRRFERCAIVSDIPWVRNSCRLMGVMMPWPLRVFANSQWEEALQWLKSSPPPSGLTHRLVPEKGVLLIELRGPLRAEDFEAIAVTVDPWIEDQGSLHGLIVHGRQFPGWENLGALIEHLRFVLDHHRKIQRVAMAVDGKIGELGPKLAGHFVQAEVKHFEFDGLDEAMAWASAGRKN